MIRILVLRLGRPVRALNIAFFSEGQRSGGSSLGHQTGTACDAILFTVSSDYVKSGHFLEH
jgi:hypothetical protein